MKPLVLGFTAGFRKDGIPTISNLALLSYSLSHNPEVKDFPLALQSELAEIAAFDFPNLRVEKVISTGKEGLIYRFDTEEVVQQGVEHAAQNDYDTIYILAYPLFHRQLCWFFTKIYARRYGMEVRILRTGWIPCDRTSDQWFTRHPLLVAIYPLIHVIGKLLLWRSAV